MTYNKIIVPLDGSPLAETALPFAEELAGKAGSEIVLLTVLQSEETHEYKKHQAYATKIINLTRRHIEKYVEKSGSQAVSVGTATRVGNPAEGILDYVSKGGLNLIVMATHGRSGISRWAVGSIADKVVRASTRQPLMLIRAKGGHPDIRAKRILKRALVPLDGSTRSEAVFPWIREIAQSLRMEVTLLQVVPGTNHTLANAETYLQSCCSQLNDQGILAGYEVRVGAAAEQIIDVADELATDIVAMSTRGQDSINLWPIGSTTQKVLLGGNTPLLLVKS
ncbi:universal stress protein [Chloroflexota bacterium]